jgi:tetratricopeptide (TPR) repeat protein
MRLFAIAMAAALGAVVLAPGVNVFAADGAKRNGGEAETHAPQTPSELRADLYARLAASTDADETEGLVTLMFAAYGRSGSDTGDLLLQRARKAIDADDYDDAEEILDAAVQFMPDRAEAWNARATVRFLDDDYDGSMADIAQTLKRDPRHIGALIGMASILESRDKNKEALEVYERVLAIAPHWKTAEDATDKLRIEVEGQAL